MGKQQNSAVGMQLKIRSLKAALNKALINRDREIDGLMIALLAKEHILFLGPPGTAKSLLTDQCCKAIEGATYFNYLMSKYTVPEELFGPFSLPALKSGKYERVVSGKLPEAEIVFLDEIFKSNSSILNALLTIVNEREFDNGAARVSVPLETLVGASNELPESKELAALYDRFMLRFWVDYLSDRQDKKTMLMMAFQEVGKVLTIDELRQAQQEVLSVTIAEEMIDLLLDIQGAVEEAGFVASDRRWRKSLRLLQASAYLNGRSSVSEDDMLVLIDSLWNEPAERDILSQVITKAANPALAAAEALIDASRETYGKLPLTGDIPQSRAGQVFQQVVDANAQFNASIKKLKSLDKNNTSQKIQGYIKEIQNMQEEATRLAGRASGLNI